MARMTQLAILLVSALFFLSLPGVVYSQNDHFFVEGEVYCDVCRAKFINRLSEPMSGAKVRLECKKEEGGQVTFSVEGDTNDKGVYRLAVDGDHEEEICEITLVKSSRPDCDEIPYEGWAQKPYSRISVTANNGIHDDTRRANPLSFSKKEANPACVELYKELDMLPEDQN